MEVTGFYGEYGNVDSLSEEEQKIVTKYAKEVEEKRLLPRQRMKNNILRNSKKRALQFISRKKA